MKKSGGQRGVGLGMQKDKIRDVKFNQETQRLASINPNGKVTLWDANLNSVRSVSFLRSHCPSQSFKQVAACRPLFVACN